MGRLYLLRHARAAKAAPGLGDFDRPLVESGRSDAAAMGRAMAGRGWFPDRILCSTALRARETLAAVGGHLDTGRAEFLDSLYGSEAAEYLLAIRKEQTDASLLLVGHNPMMHDLAAALPGACEDAARERLKRGFPTAGLAVIRVDGPLSRTVRGGGYLEAFLAPDSL